ncbi:MAG: DUF1311 domain-containing protein [Synechococcus sp.]|nr:DUF1311 domain-containing protein [Synechococcus sp.]
MQIPQALLASSVLLIETASGPAIAKPIPPCQDSVSTLELNRCLDQALTQSDADLLRELKQVALDAAEIPSPVFSTLWRDNLTGFFQTSADPKEQFQRFQAERRQICAYAKSMAFQGTGYGSFIRHCELALNQALKDQLKP